VAGRVT
jgi:hypothetical protein